MPDDSQHGGRGAVETSHDSVSRRKVLTHGAAAVVGAGTAFWEGDALAVQTIAPAIQDRSDVAGRRFRAFVRHGSSASVQELRLLPLAPRRVVVRSEASQCCYTSVPQVLGTEGVRQPVIPGHGGSGIVEAVGSGVKRVQVGDRVIVTVTPWCGECYNCMHGRADRCLGLREPLTPIAQMQDGTVINGNVGGHSELMVGDEEWFIPVFTTVPGVELSLLSCVSSCGLGTTMSQAPVEAGSDVVVFGAGPVGLSAIQGARIKGASQIIAVEPIRYRRELALKVGATVALDPNAEGNNLVQKIQELCRPKSDRRWAGGGNIGPDFVIEAVGGDLYPPKEPGPDPTGILVLRQAWQLCSAAGSLVTTGVGHPANATVNFPASQWANGQKHHLPGKGTNLKRDLPRFVRFIETKQFDAKSLISATYPLERTREAYQAAAERTNVNSVIVFP